MRNVFCTLTILFFTTSLLANNITVSNTGLSGQNTTSDFTLINFDVAWENSWRTSTNESNYDGAWIFVKFRKNGTTDWRHCTINATGNTNGAGSAYSIPTDGKGAFIFRSGDGLGNVNFTGNSLRWNYGLDGLLDNDSVEIRVFALESVYIPQGAYYLGSGGTEPNAFQDGSTGNPFLVISNSAITRGTTTGTLNPNGMGAASGTIPAAFPKGFNAFWIMKYETSQQQYVDFLNHLDLARATANNAAFFSGTHPNLIAPQPERGMQAIGTSRAAALADWSGLRPMTELEFEKASRGFNIAAVPNEFVWGNTTINGVNVVTDPGLSTEAVSSPAAANANYGTILNVPTRVGIFARPSGSSRTLSGGTYYGVMNMGDNLNEVCITIANAQGLAIDAAVHGDGYLAASGTTDIVSFQPYQAYGFRGSAYNAGPDQARTSYRANANIFTVTFGGDSNQASYGCRLVRTAQ